MSDRIAAIKFFNQAQAALADRTRDNHLALAYSLYSSSVVVDPDFAQGWYSIGSSNSDMQLLPAAVANFRRALECPEGDGAGALSAPLKARTLCNLGHRLYHLGKFDEARVFLEKSVELEPKFSFGWTNLSLIESHDGNLQAGVDLARLGFQIDGNPTNELALALNLMFNREFAAGLAHFECRFAYKLHHFLQYPYPKWDGRPGQTLFLVSDQGLGDTISFSRFMEAACARSKFVHAAVHPELKRLFAAMFGHIPNLNLIPTPPSFVAADCWTTFVSLPHVLGLTDEEIINWPDPKVPAFTAQGGWKAPGRKLHIGVTWAGAPGSDIDRWRSFPLHHLLELYRVPGIQLYSLQVGDHAKDVHDQGCGALVLDLTPHIRDVADTIGLLRDLDMVITVESAMGHIAGLVHKETWVPYSYNGRDYRAGHDGSQPLWYRNHRFFKQKRGEEWEPVFERIVEAVRERVDGPRRIQDQTGVIDS
jgi:hypothetical protein